MSAVVSLPASAPAPAAIADVVEADGWLPGVAMSELRDAMRIGAAVTPIRLRQAVIGAIRTIRLAVAAWKLTQTAASLAEIEAETIGGESELVQLYRRAVFGLTAADLVETHRTVSATKDGADRSDDEDLTADDHRRNAWIALRDLIGEPRTIVELI